MGERVIAALLTVQRSGMATGVKKTDVKKVDTGCPEVLEPEPPCLSGATVKLRSFRIAFRLSFWSVGAEIERVSHDRS